MRPMNHPNYRHSPWTPERRKAASERAKARWAEKRAAEEAEWRAEQQTITARLRNLRYAKRYEMEQIAQRYHALKAEVAELDSALELAKQLSPILRKFDIKGEVVR